MNIFSIYAKVPESLEIYGKTRLFVRKKYIFRCMKGKKMPQYIVIKSQYIGVVFMIFYG